MAVEVDPELIAHLDKNLDIDNLEVIHENILKFDLTKLPPNYKVVANIPYYLTSNLLRVLSESPNPFSQAALLVQKEVAQRVAAKPGKMSLLSVGVQFYCEARLGELITADKFSPPPKVDSQVLILNRHKEPIFGAVDEKKFFQIVKAGFSQRRKTILNSLSSGLRIERENAEQKITQAGLNPGDRPQVFSMHDWYKLYLQFN